MRRWTTGEVRYLDEHAHEGAAAIARALGRSVYSVQQQASTYRISLQIRWHCPRCGHWTRRPLDSRTGWCAVCTKAERRRRYEQEVRELEEEVMREREEDRMRQALYARKCRVKKKRRDK